jgi:hypothetical protein
MLKQSLRCHSCMQSALHCTCITAPTPLQALTVMNLVTSGEQVSIMAHLLAPFPTQITALPGCIFRVRLSHLHNHPSTPSALPGTFQQQHQLLMVVLLNLLASGCASLAVGAASYPVPLACVSHLA